MNTHESHTRPTDTTHAHRDVIELFVYGTLRPGGSNYPRVADLIEPDHAPAWVRGRMYASTAGAWPLLEPRQHGDDWVRGELLTVPPSPEFWALMGMLEVEWGYDLIWHPIHDAPGGALLGRALLCAWSWPKDRGAPIPEGDWLVHLGL